MALGERDATNLNIRRNSQNSIVFPALSLLLAPRTARIALRLVNPIQTECLGMPGGAPKPRTLEKIFGPSITLEWSEQAELSPDPASDEGVLEPVELVTLRNSTRTAARLPLW